MSTTQTQPTFYQDIAIPLNLDNEENRMDLVNLVHVAEMFAKATSWAAMLAQQAEDITGEIANLEHQMADVSRELRALRRRLLADGLSGMKSGWNSEQLDAYVLRLSVEQGCAALLATLEREVEEFEIAIAVRKPRQLRIKERLRILEKNMDYAKQYLDYEKLQVRASLNGRQ